MLTRFTPLDICNMKIGGKSFLDHIVRVDVAVNPQDKSFRVEVLLFASEAPNLAHCSEEVSLSYDSGYVSYEGSGVITSVCHSAERDYLQTQTVVIEGHNLQINDHKRTVTVA